MSGFWIIYTGYSNNHRKLLLLAYSVIIWPIIQMAMKHTIVIALAALMILARPAVVLAVDAPEFPLCANPSGQVIVSYENGTHGIVGDSTTYTGSDTVYSVGETEVMQCFCAADGNGIQTNWWNASSLSQEDVAVLKAEGWIYVPDGNLWGLSESPYLAKNTTYSCLPGGTGGTGGGDIPPSPHGDGLSDGKSDGRSSCPECTAPPAIGGGGQVLGLAATGDSWILYSVFAAALFLFVSGVRKLRKSR